MSLSCDDAAYRRHHIWLLLHLHVRVVGLVYHWSVTCIIHHLSWLVFTCHDECVMMNRIGLLMNGNEKANEGQERAKRPKRSQGQRPALKTKRLFGSKTRSSRLNVSIGEGQVANRSWLGLMLYMLFGCVEIFALVFSAQQSGIKLDKIRSKWFALALRDTLMGEYCLLFVTKTRSTEL